MPKRLWQVVCLIAFAVLAIAASAPAQTNLASTVVTDADFNIPLFVTHAPGDHDRIFIVGKAGEIWILHRATGTLTQFLQITVDFSFREEGLLGFAFHPDYANNGYFYVDYTASDTKTIVARYEVTVDPDVADPLSEQIVMEISHGPGQGENGGWLGFGPHNGYLYIAQGEGEGAATCEAQDMGLLLGKILRVDIDGDDFPADPNANYAIPPDNPFVGVAGAREEIWVSGLSNPWRCSFDTNGDLYITDVGENQREEVNYQPASSPGGENYGWPCREGTLPMSPACCGAAVLTDPLHEYNHAVGNAVIGGYVYRGAAIPDLYGAYVFADRDTFMWRLRHDGATVTELVEIRDQINPSIEGTDLFKISSFGLDAAGELYVVDGFDLDAPFEDQEIFQIIGAGACCLPDGMCEEPYTVATCSAAGGIYAGNNTDCAGASCGTTGACCVGAVCTVETMAMCVGIGGVYHGDGTVCVPDPCLASPVGGCCFPGVPCQVATEADCLTGSGVYLGDGTDCALDTDGDGPRDCEDGCPLDPAKTDPGTCGCGTPDTDTDFDGTPDCIDGCPLDSDKIAPGDCGCGNPETDTDEDGTPDCIDGCPLDPDKIAPGVCDCGTPDTDTDMDGTPDCIDGCPLDPLKIAPGVCDCGTPDIDTDADGFFDCEDNCPGDFNPGQEDCDGDGTGDACAGEPDCNLNGVPDSCDIDSGFSLDLDTDGIPDECQGQLEAGTVVAGGTPVTVNLVNTYASPVVVCTANYTNNTTPIVTRVSSVTTTSFDVRLQNPSDGAVAAETVSYVVMEEGTWVIDGVPCEAQIYISTVTDRFGAWGGEPQIYGQTYVAPVVLGQVMTENDPDWSVFWSSATSRFDPPSSTTLFTGKAVCEDPDTTRIDEMVGFIVIETGRGTIGGVEYEAQLGPNGILGVDNAPPYSYTFTTPFGTAPQVTIACQAAMDGGNGGWAQTHGPTPTVTTRIDLSIDEDQTLDAERTHLAEQVGYLVLETPLVISPPGTGACCLPSGMCEDDHTLLSCTGVGGSYQGDGSDCATVVCGAFGGCCHDATCTVETLPECTTLGGVYLGDGTDCSLDTDSDGFFDCEDNCPGDFNPGQEDCDGDGTGDACAGEPDCNLNGVPDSCDIDSGFSLDLDTDGIPDECQGQLEAGTVVAGGTPVTVNLVNTYASPVVVCTANYTNNTTPIVTRVSSVTTTSFDVRLQNPSDGAVAAETVSYVVMEEGTWVIDGVPCEAQIYISTVTDRFGAWGGEPQIYGQTYVAPVVLGQVMTENDPDWSVFWSSATSRFDPPSSTTLFTGKAVCEDPDTTRIDEMVGFIVIETGRGTIGGVEYEAQLGPNGILGVDNAPPYSYTFTTPFGTTPQVTIACQAAMDGGNGGWAQTHGPTPTVTTRIDLSIDEDQTLDAERTHLAEQVGYLVLETPLVISPPGTGACCLPSGMCEDDHTLLSCTGVGGSYQGDGSDCATVVCGAFGGCCHDATCTVETLPECTTLGGVYLGDGTDCSLDTDSDGFFDCEDNCPGDFNPGQEDCDGDGTGDACAGEPDCNLNGVPDSCDIDSGFSLDLDTDGIPDECQGQLEAGTVVAGGTPVTVNLVNTYASPVVVCTANYTNNTTPIVTRVSSVTTTSFDVRLQNPSDGAVAAETVSYVVMEEGTWVIDGVPCEAQIYISTVTDRFGAWGGEPQIYGQTYVAPVVLGQVMTENDPDWSVFWSSATSRFDPPSSTTLFTGKAVCEDPDTTRIDEMVGFIVIETGRGTIGGVEYEAQLGPNGILGVDNAPPYSYTFTTPFGTTPQVTIACQAAMDGGNGGWAQTHGPTPTVTTRIDLSIDEDQTLDAERTHLAEQVGYLVLETPLVVSLDMFSLEEKLNEDDLAVAGLDTEDAFGLSVSIDGDLAIAGAFRDETDEAGSAYILRRTGTIWALEQKLDEATLAADGLESDDFFGHSVAIEGSVAIVGAPQDETSNAGAAYVFRETAGTWILEQKLDESSLAASGLDASDKFGWVVDLSGDVAVVGAFQDEPSFAGAVYIFRYTGATWALEQKLDNSMFGADGLDANDNFGLSVAIDGDVLIVGAKFDEPGDAGSAYIFRHAGGGVWNLEQKLDNAMLAGAGHDAGDFLGQSVAIDGDVAIVGARADEPGEAGSAYVFRYDAGVWTLAQKLDQTTLAEDGLDADDWFGWSVAIEAGTAVVGAKFDDTSEAGSVYIFRLIGGTWTLQQKFDENNLFGDGLDVADAFGYAVSLGRYSRCRVISR